MKKVLVLNGSKLNLLGTRAGRFFFEIIQRTGDNDGYGALNAPARIASQVQRFSTAAYQ
jgi:4-hydroxyphenylpyruvate dioxygenase-like putative hemolysin